MVIINLKCFYLIFASKTRLSRPSNKKYKKNIYSQVFIFVMQKESTCFNDEDVIFFEHQLDLYGNLCYVGTMNSIFKMFKSYSHF